MNEMILIGSIAVYPDRIKAIANDIYVGGRPDAPKEKSVTIEYNDGTKYQAHGIDIKEAIEILNKYNEKFFKEVTKSVGEE